MNEILYSACIQPAAVQSAVHIYILPHAFSVHAEHIAEQNKPALRHMHLLVQPTLQPHEIISKTLSGATSRSVGLPIGYMPVLKVGLY